MKTVYKTLVFVGAIVLAACSRNIVPETGNQDSPYIPVEYDIDDELKPSVWYASDIPDYMKEALGLRNVMIADNIDEAGIIVVASNELETYRRSLMLAMSQGRMVFEMWPDNRSHYEFWTSIGFRQGRLNSPIPAGITSPTFFSTAAENTESNPHIIRIQVHTIRIRRHPS